MYGGNGAEMCNISDLEGISIHVVIFDSVGTSDNLVQMIIFGTGAERVSAKEFYDEVSKCEEELRELIKKNNTK